VLIFKYLKINFKYLKIVNHVMRSMPRKRKIQTRYKTTTERGYREYMRKYMRMYKGIPSYRYKKRGRRPKKE
jgi:hypothetical protein